MSRGVRGSLQWLWQSAICLVCWFPYLCLLSRWILIVMKFIVISVFCYWDNWLPLLKGLPIGSKITRSNKRTGDMQYTLMGVPARSASDWSFCDYLLHGNNLRCSTSCRPCTGCQPSGYVKDLSIELLCSYTNSHGRYLGESLKLTQLVTMMDCPLLASLLVS